MSINLEYIFNPVALEEAKKKLDKKPRKSKAKRRRYSKYKARLDLFWSQTPSSPQARHKKLRDIAKFVSNKATARDLYVKRRSFESKKYGLLKLDKCYVCKEKAVHRHHLIQLQYGGTNIKKNLVGLCELCHTTIHPFMLEVQEAMELDERMHMLIRSKN